MVVCLQTLFCLKVEELQRPTCAFRAMMGSVKCIIALSARIGLRMTLFVFFRSMMTVSAGVLGSLLTWRTQTYLSDSRVQFCHEIDAGRMFKLVSSVGCETCNGTWR